jgi:hypothetical protein
MGKLVKFQPANLPPYLPLASRVTPLQFSDLQSQVVFLLATSPVDRKANVKMKNKEHENRHKLAKRHNGID